jgi:hypothetical protein
MTPRRIAVTMPNRVQAVKDMKTPIQELMPMVTDFRFSGQKGMHHQWPGVIIGLEVD